ncbi:MAG: 23S rRNA (cytosine(1962)-C(5))-methyltransferase RlmI, partial [Pseudomonadota bacterium]
MSSYITLQKGREKSLLRQHPWIFTSAIDKHQGKLHSGDTVDVLAHDNKWLGRAAWSPESSIRARVWTFDKEEIIDNAFFLRRIENALQGRALLKLDSNAMRIVAAECDGLPG